MDKISIIGISCLFPDAHNKSTFWNNLINNKDSISNITEKDWGIDPSYLYDPEVGKKDKIYYLKGGPIRDFEPPLQGYDLPENYLKKLDRAFHWGLYVAKEALI